LPEKDLELGNVPLLYRRRAVSRDSCVFPGSLKICFENGGCCFEVIVAKLTRLVKWLDFQATFESDSGAKPLLPGGPSLVARAAHRFEIC
jgi:hypothetical protein